MRSLLSVWKQLPQQQVFNSSVAGGQTYKQQVTYLPDNRPRYVLVGVAAAAASCLAKVLTLLCALLGEQQPLAVTAAAATDLQA